MVVAGSGPRAVVTTASYEARRFGIFSATPAEQARRLCPEAVFVPPDFELYRHRSSQVMDVLRRHVERVEVVGLDEAYLDLSGLDRPRGRPSREGRGDRRDRPALLRRHRPGKLVAKVASDADKPDGFLELTAAEARERFAGASPGMLPGIGPKTARRLEAHGVNTLGALAATPQEHLRAWFGTRLGPYLGRLARFEDERVLQTARPAKSESRETTFDSDLRGLSALEPALERLAGELCRTLARQERRGRTIGIKVRFDDFKTVTRARTLATPVNDLETVAGVALELLGNLASARPVRLLGVRVAGLAEGRRAAPAAPADQLSLSL